LSSSAQSFSPSFAHEYQIYYTLGEYKEEIRITLLVGCIWSASMMHEETNQKLTNKFMMY
jgi:hypothetical protein